MLYTWFVDADGTLWRHNPVREALVAVAELLGLDGLGEFYSLHRQLLHERRYLEAYSWDLITGNVARRHGVSDIAGVFKYGFEKGLEELELLPGVEEALERAKSSGVQLVVVSNGLYRYIAPPLHGSGLSKYFVDVVTPDRVRIYWAPRIKPHRPIFSEAARRAPAHHYTVIGDNYVDDAVGGLLWGAEKVFLLGSRMRREPLDDPCALLLDGDPVRASNALGHCEVSLGEFLVVESWSDIGAAADG